MNTLPIPADSIDHLFSTQIAADLKLFTAEENAQAKSLLDPGAGNGWHWQSLNAALPYMVAYYRTPDGWLCTTRRAMPANAKVPGIMPRELDSAACWVGATPTSALLSMIADRLTSKEFSFSRGNTSVGVLSAFGEALSA